MKQIHDFKGLFVEQLNEQYEGERLQLLFFPQLRQKTDAVELQAVIDEHTKKAERHIQRLEEIFDSIEEPVHMEENRGIEGLIQEADELVKRCPERRIRDAAIAIAIQHLHNHNISSYKTLSAYAEDLALDNVSVLIQASLYEEKESENQIASLNEENLIFKAMH